MLPLSVIPSKRRVHRKRRAAAQSSPGPVALTLVAASYEPGTYVEVSFDRAIDVSGIDGSAIIVADGEFQGFRYFAGGAAEMQGPQTVRIDLSNGEEWAEPGVRLTASALSGIVAVDDGGTWAGVTDVGLPFP